MIKCTNMKVKTLIMTVACVALCSMGASAQKQVIYTGDLAKKVIGYNGTTPLNITIEKGVITDIEALPNDETPRFFKKVVDKIFPQYIGKTVDEAKKMKVDAVTGATYSSEAVLENIKKGLDQVKAEPAKKAAVAEKKQAKTKAKKAPKKTERPPVKKVK